MILIRYTVLSFLISLLTLTAWANEIKCFCLVDDAGNIRYGCLTQQKGPREETRCLDDEDNEQVLTDAERDGWQKVNAGEGVCSQCRPKIAIEAGGIRGGDK